MLLRNLDSLGDGTHLALSGFAHHSFNFVAAQGELEFNLGVEAVIEKADISRIG
jgi:hypothetical protein